MPVPQRIVILGPSGAGKSTLARCLGARLGLPVVHLDAINWNPGWVQTEPERFRARLAEAAATESWVMDGNYTSHLDLRLPRAEAVIWLDLPRYVYFHAHCGEQHATTAARARILARAALKDSILSFFRDWVWTYPMRSRARHAELVANLPAGIRGIILRSRADVRSFTDNLPGSLEAHTDGVTPCP